MRRLLLSVGAIFVAPVRHLQRHLPLLMFDPGVGICLPVLLLVQPSSSPPAGVWQADGYGTIWEIAGDTLQSWEVTTTTCVRAGRYVRSAMPPPGAGLAFLDGAITAWIIRPGPNGRRFVAHSPGTVADVFFHKRNALPSTCVPPTADTREANFEVFQRTMGEQYASFRLRGLDWDAVVGQARTKLGSATTR